MKTESNYNNAKTIIIIINNYKIPYIAASVSRKKKKIIQTTNFLSLIFFFFNYSKFSVYISGAIYRQLLLKQPLYVNGCSLNTVNFANDSSPSNRAHGDFRAVV